MHTNQLIVFLIVITVYFLIEIYVFGVVRALLAESSDGVRRSAWIIYWGISLIALIGVLFYTKLDPVVFRELRLFILTLFFVNLMAKLAASLLVAGDDFRRLVTFLYGYFSPATPQTMPGRSAFMAKAAMAAGAVPLAVFSFGILTGAYDYRVRRKSITFPNLPRAFDGIRVVQISDIHTGSFFNKTAVQGGIDLINGEKPDLVLFTGDLVNDESAEAKPYLDIFKKIKSPMGVFSTMGNHDYGDYRSWSSAAARQQDIRDLQAMHRYMGWDILLNEHRILRVEGEEIGLLGVENWGAGRFSKYGDLAKTYQGTDDLPFKMLMSHDPSHWDAQIRPEFGSIDLTLAGHTHGMQLGIEIGDFRWSPSQYMYKQWADLYQEGSQYLYVNRGYGFIGYPGRIGILPEITVLELRRA